MKKILICFLYFPILLAAQTNESDSTKLQASLSLTGFVQGGNVQTLIFRASSDVSYRPSDKFVFKTKNSYVYQEFGQNKADEDILSLNFLYFNSDKKIYPLILAFVSTNFRRKINLRSLVGAGATYQVFKHKGSWLKFSLTSEYEQTEFESALFNRSEFNGNTAINTLRATIWVNGKYQLFDKKLIINHESYYQPSLERSGNYRWQADVGFELPLTKRFNFKINYVHTFESIVIVEQKQRDNMLTFGFTLKNF